MSRSLGAVSRDQAFRDCFRIAEVSLVRRLRARGLSVDDAGDAAKSSLPTESSAKSVESGESVGSSRDRLSLMHDDWDD